MDYVCKGNSLFQVFCKELHCICNLVFEGLRSMSPILEVKPVKWLWPVLGWKWYKEFRYVNSRIKPSSLFLSADVNGEILFVPCCWKYFCVSAHQVTIKLLLIQSVSVFICCDYKYLQWYVALLICGFGHENDDVKVSYFIRSVCLGRYMQNSPGVLKTKNSSLKWLHNDPV